MLEISERLRDTQLIFICGRNAKLAERLKAQRADAPRFIEGFTQEVPYYMYLSDFFIGKPGPGSISEAVAMKLPVIVESPTLDPAAGALQHRVGAGAARGDGGG